MPINKKQKVTKTRKHRGRSVTRKQCGGNDCAHLGGHESDGPMNAFINAYTAGSHGIFKGVCQFQFTNGPNASPTVYVVYITPLPGRIGGYCLKGNLYEFGYLVYHSNEGQGQFVPYS